MSKPPGKYYPNIVQEFFANYLALVEKDYPKGTKVSDFPNNKLVPMRGVTINISACILNKILFGLDYEASMTIPKLEHLLMIASTQRPRFSRVFTDDSNPSWSLNTKEQIAKSSLSF